MATKSFYSYPRRAGIEGVIILEVPSGTPAYAAGLRGLGRDRFGRRTINDVITAVDRAPVTSYDDLFAILESRKIGETVTLSVDRAGKVRPVRVTLVRD